MSPLFFIFYPFSVNSRLFFTFPPVLKKKILHYFLFDTQYSNVDKFQNPLPRACKKFSSMTEDTHRIIIICRPSFFGKGWYNKTNGHASDLPLGRTVAVFYNPLFFVMSRPSCLYCDPEIHRGPGNLNRHSFLVNVCKNKRLFLSQR